MVRIGGVGAAVVLMGMGVTAPASAQQSVLTAAGFSGYSVTPTAHLLPWGNISFAYDNEVVGGPGTQFSRYGTSGHNFVGGVGVLPNLEISGRIAANTIHSNCFVEGCGIRDLSFNFKAGTALDTAGRWNAAVGATDFGGTVNFFRTYYGVLSYSPDQFDFSLGYARRGNELVGNTKPLDGVFGSAAYQPFPWLQTHVEYTDSKAYAGARVFAPSAWLPTGWMAHLGVNFRVRGDEPTSRSWVGVGLTVPLYKVPTTRPAAATYATTSASSAPVPNELVAGAPPSAFAAPVASMGATVREFSTDGLQQSAPLVVAAAPVPAMPSAASQPTSAATALPVTDAQLQALAEELRVKGFEDIAVGRMSGGAIAVRVNNATYNVNTVDGLGVALGVIARRLNEFRVGYRLVLTQRQTEIIGVTGQTDCLAEWIALRPPRCVAGQLHTPGISNLSALLDGAAWVVDGKAPSWATARLMLQPVVRTGVATDYGVLDYSAGIRATVQQPLWKGAYFEVSHIAPIGESRDYKPGQPYGNDRLVNTTDKVLLHQVVRLPVEKLFGEANAKTAAEWGANAVTAHAAVGRINASYQGVYGELRWEPFEGRHRFGVEGGRFERTTSYDFSFPLQSRSVLGSYRYHFTPTKTDFRVAAGQFLYNDQGAEVTLTQWFDDVAVNLYMRRSKREFEPTARTFAGVELVIPLTPRKDMTPTAHVQVTGTPRFSYSLETKLGDGLNFITRGLGEYPGVAVLDRTFNSDRASVNYFEDNMARIRSAASK